MRDTNKKPVTFNISKMILRYLNDVAGTDEKGYLSKSYIVNRILAVEFAKGNDHIRQIVLPESIIEERRNNIATARLITS